MNNNSKLLLSITQLEVNHGGRAVLLPFDWTVRAGERWAILGANGTGKTSVLHALLGVVPSMGSKVIFDGESLSNQKPHQLSDKRVWVAQHYDEPFTLTVHQALRSMAFEASDDVLDSALQTYGLKTLSAQWVHTLSGGERQRLMWAMAHARTTDVTQLWLLDEPLAAQDLAWQSRLLTQLKTASCAVIAAIHDLNHVAQFATHVLLIQKTVPAAKVIAAGTVDDVMKSELLSAAYGVQLKQIHSEGEAWWTLQS